MKFNFKKLLIYIIITFLIGSFFTLYLNDINLYDNLNKSINVPSVLFPIVWSVLYFLMAISAYIISESKDLNKKIAMKYYFIQLIVNSLWTLLFFGFKLYVISFIWIIFLIFLVIIMIIKFYKINKIAGILNIPYIFWLLFAAYLSFSIILLN